jgi:hypothetical protein
MRQDRSEMPYVREENFRALLDDRGILRPGALVAPEPSNAFTVFAQRKDSRLEADLWRRHASQFFATRIDFPVLKQYLFDPPASDAAEVTIASPTRPEAKRLCFARPRTDDDLLVAEDLDRRAGSNGLGLLARRCPTVWLVCIEEETDDAALQIAAIVASVVLGPIVSPGGTELFGVRTARSKLEFRIPYR